MISSLLDGVSLIVTGMMIHHLICDWMRGNGRSGD
jgi:hypothetical protein